ncbi:nucleotidyltransferase domain-containing protein [Azospirillum thermophilum]|uniref:Nucleotidyltransferase family protein n=1 Tax=Azospirillum thermophilum TaxID=2202148 RepID=A0A2S2CL73_9PROT|nr:nucleotidyltransferase family protein [Azospirillum thermophilum]AWK85179.1 hypothetical protein DEW08_02375 [Azospirillum thermophilum]
MPPQSQDRLAPEFRYLCAAVRASLPAAAPPVPPQPETAIDWPAVVRGAARHRATGLVLAGLQTAALPAPPAAEMGKLRRNASALARVCLANAAETLRLAGMLQAAGIRVMVLKGVVLSQQLHGDPARRDAGDIDLLVDPARFWDAEAVLLQAGYEPDGPLIPGSHRAAGQALLRDLSYRNRARGTLVELHQRLTANPHRLDCSFEALWRAHGEVRLAGRAVATLPDRILPLYLCVHGAHHCWERLCWLADLAALLDSPDAVRRTLDDAEAAGLGRSMRLAVGLCNRLLGLPLPEEALPAGPWARRVDRFIHSVFGGTAWLEEPAKGTAAWVRRELRQRLHVYALKPGWRHRWNELQADLRNPADWGVIPLPARLIWLYPALRPIGWVVRTLRRRRSLTGRPRR